MTISDDRYYKVLEGDIPKNITELREFYNRRAKSLSVDIKVGDCCNDSVGRLVAYREFINLLNKMIG